MGKPFNDELKKLEITYNWGVSLTIEDLNEIKYVLLNKPLFIVGSGGSFSACILMSLLHQYKGTIANAITPLDLQYQKNAITKDTNVCFISASGKNTDILFAFESIITREPANVLSICFKKNSPLSQKTSNFSISKIIEFDNPVGKDGFLATNSLLAYFLILSKIYNEFQEIPSIVPNSKYLEEISSFAKSLHEDFTIIVLYGGWGKPVAYDIESKFSEAGLGNILLTDYRNFGHGRHNWFDKKNKQSAIVALITLDEEELASKTLSLLPNTIPVLKIKSDFSTATASTDLLIKSFYLVNEAGNLKKIDPGKPGVPSYGSKLYHLKYSRFYSDKNSNLSENARLAITRKFGNLDRISIVKNHLDLWINSYNTFKKKINSTLFKGILLDYDGTLCTSKERFDGPRMEVVNYLTEFMKLGILVGVVTGRGKSVRIDLQKVIPKKYWKNFVIGYYNGSQIGTLENDNLPLTTHAPSKILTEIKNYFITEPILKSFIKTELRPEQLTLEILDKENATIIKEIIIDTLKNNYAFKIQVLESSHSIDIIPITTTKVSIIQECRKILNDTTEKYNFLCIGDRGKWPGNDYQLLATEFSLSVDEVSNDPNTCWNLSPVGISCVNATLEYFKVISPKESFFNIKL